MSASLAGAQPAFEPQGGYVVMEVESAPASGDWVEESTLAGASGSYYRYDNSRICSSNPDSPLRFTMRIDRAATYALHLRAAKFIHCVSGAPRDNGGCTEHDRTCDSLGAPGGDGRCPAGQCFRTDISNDAWVRIERDGDYVPFDGQPGGTVGRDIKLFGGGADSWNWTGRRSLDISGKHDALWSLEPGTYTLIVQGRSGGFRIDRIAFFDESMGNARAADDMDETRVDPMDGDPTDPMDGDPTDPMDGDPTDPMDGDPMDGDPTDPMDGDPTDPMDGDPTDSMDGDPMDGDPMDGDPPAEPMSMPDRPSVRADAGPGEATPESSAMSGGCQVGGAPSSAPLIALLVAVSLRRRHS